MLLTTVACNDDYRKPSPEDTITVASLSKAVYDDATGVFTIEFTSNGTHVQLDLGAVPMALTQTVPTLPPGTYSLSGNAGNPSVLSSTTWEEQGFQIAVSAALAAISVDKDACRIEGTLRSSSNESLSFIIPSVSFSHSEKNLIVAGNASVEYNIDNGLCHYDIDLESDADRISLALSSVSSPFSFMTIPSGCYYASQETIAGSVNTGASSWLANGTELSVSDAKIAVRANGGSYAIGGILESENGSRIRFIYNGDPVFPQSSSPYPFTAMQGDWEVSTDSIYTYIRATKSWEKQQEQQEYELSMMGMPSRSAMLLTGIFDQSFSMLMGLNGSFCGIPCNVEANPVAEVYSTTGTYRLFATLIDPDTGYFISQ